MMLKKDPKYYKTNSDGTNLIP